MTGEIQRRMDAEATAVEPRRCEGRMWTGRRRGSPCTFAATGYQRRYDLHLCGYHARAYRDVEPAT